MVEQDDLVTFLHVAGGSEAQESSSYKLRCVSVHATDLMRW